MLNWKELDTASMIKWAILAVLVAFSCYVTFPAKEKVRLGLDLKGGTSFTVQIDEQKLVEDLEAEAYNAKNIAPEAATPELKANITATAKARAQQIMTESDDLTLEVLRKRIDAIGTNEPIIAKADNHRILIQIPGADEVQAAAAEASVKSAAFLEFRLVSKENTSDVAKLMEKTDVTPEGFVRSTCNAQPCFVRADNYADLYDKDSNFQKKALYKAAAAAGISGLVYECMLEEVGRDDVTGQVAYQPIFVSRSPENRINGDTVTKATPSKELGKTVVNLEFDSDGTKKFAALTTKYAGKNRQLAIALDDVVRSAPVLQTPIRDGRCEISGRFTWKEASDLAGVLNAGALKAPIRIIEKRTVSPSLGEEAISKGTMASIIGVSAVLIFMLCYYFFCGVVANLALALNMILWPAGMIIASGVMSVFVFDGTGSTSLGQLPVLTLPGIAGLVLSIGMAVDANVLIFERMREEFRSGKTAKSSVASGYDRAFLAIFDSNLTTLITGVILFIFGSGPIRGFAVTLCGGIIISMFTALVITRLIFNLTTKDTTKPFKMAQWVSENVHFDFIKWAKPAAIASASIILVTLGIFFARAFSNPASVMAVDFTGGVALTYNAVKDGQNVELDTEKVREVVAATGVTDQTVQSSKGADGVQTLVKTSTVNLPQTNEKGETVEVASSLVIEKALDAAFPEYKVTLDSEDRVGSQIGSELKKDAFWSIVVSLICIIIYVSFRFQFGFALGGVVALAHDALITLGIFTICGCQVSLTTVAALLTIVGYSINDTIVVFDRIREMMARDENMPFPELVNKALNMTLSRTVLTTLSTLLPVGALYFFGGAAMHDFAFALFIGLLVGTYSTLFLAPTVMLMWYRGKRPRKVEVSVDPTLASQN